MIGFTYKDRHSSEFGLKLSQVERGVLPPIKNNTQTLKFGEFFYTSGLEPRVFEVTCFLDSPNLFAFQEALREIGGWLYSTTPQKLIFDEEDDVYYMAILDGDSSVTQELVHGEIVLKFICYDPYAYSDVVTKVEDKEQFGYIGTADTYPTILLTGVNNPFISFNNAPPLLINYSCEKTPILIDCKKGYISSGGKNILPYLHLGSNFPKIIPGINTVTSNAHFLITYNERYV